MIRLGMDTMCTNTGYTDEVYKREPEKSRSDKGRIANHQARASQPKVSAAGRP